MTTHTTQHSSRPSQHGEPGPAPCRAADGRRAGDRSTLFPLSPRPADTPRNPEKGAGQHGFTMIEVVAVLVIIAILGVVAMDRFFDQSPAELDAVQEQVRNHLAYARTRSMSGDEVFGVRVNADGTSYAIFRNGNAASLLTVPGEADGTINLLEGFTISSTSSNIFFDRWGAPCSSAANNSRMADTVITIRYRERAATITVTRNTGFLR